MSRIVPLSVALVCVVFTAMAAETPLPFTDPKDLTVWPNHVSRANGDAWIVENHDRIRRMNPRLLLINYSNEHPTNHILKLAAQFIDILAESSRYHGYRDSN